MARCTYLARCSRMMLDVWVPGGWLKITQKRILGFASRADSGRRLQVECGKSVVLEVDQDTRCGTQIKY